jgi:septal ring factor EnvC (AmiA/AmiB activator)
MNEQQRRRDHVQELECEQDRGKLGNKLIPAYANRVGQGLLALVFVAMLMQPFSAVHAGFFDRVKEIYRLPEQVEIIEKEYEATKQQLQEQVKKFDEQKSQLAETIARSIETEERLLAQNRQLMAQNEALQQSIMAAEQAKLEQQARTRKLVMTGITVVLLVAGYFISGRLIRVVVWKRQKRSLRK